MSAALYPVLESEVEDIDATLVDGKNLSKVTDVLEKIAKELGVTPLMSFFGADMSDFLEEEGIEDSLQEEKWFAAADGLQSIRALIKFIKESPSAVRNSDNVIIDLEAFEQVLGVAEKHNIRWHLAVDF